MAPLSALAGVDVWERSPERSLLRHGVNREKTGEEEYMTLPLAVGREEGDAAYREEH